MYSNIIKLLKDITKPFVRYIKLKTAVDELEKLQCIYEWFLKLHSNSDDADNFQISKKNQNANKKIGK